MRAPLLRSAVLVGSLALVSLAIGETTSSPSRPIQSDEQMLRAIYTEALVHGKAFENLRALVANHPGRFSGSKALDGALGWANETLTALQPDRVYAQDVLVPHWERGETESVFLLGPTGVVTLTATALGNSAGTDQDGLLAEVVEVQSLDELTVLGETKVKGKIVFFNRPMDPATVKPGAAYSSAGDQRNRGPAAAAKLGAVGALVRSLTHTHDDIPHTGNSTFPPGTPQIPAAALSSLAADRLGGALAEAKRIGKTVLAGMKIGGRTLPDAPSHNVIAEIRGRELPEEIILAGAHLDSWDISPGAHDDGAGVVQSIEVLRIFRALGIKPRHTLRCVLFVNEENGLAGATAYASAAKDHAEKHIFAVETDTGGFDPRGFVLGSTQGDVVARAARWLPLFQPYGISEFRKGNAGADVTPLMLQGTTVGELAADSQRYFDIHHTAADTIEKVNPRELQLGAAALASLIWLVDTQGL